MKRILTATLAVLAVATLGALVGHLLPPVPHGLAWAGLAVLATRDQGGALVGVPSMAELLEGIVGKLREYNANPQHPDLIGKPDGNPVQIRPAFPNATDWTKRHREGVANSGSRYAEGVGAPRANFKEAALRNKDAWKTGIQAAVQEDRFAKGMATVDADLAIETAKTLGQQNFLNGVQGRQAKIQAKAEKLAPAAAAAVATVRQMPATTDQEREARAVAMIRAMRGVGKTLRGG